MPLHPPGEPGEEAFRRGHVAEAGERLPKPGDARYRAWANQPFACQGQERRHERDRRGDREHGDRECTEPDRLDQARFEGEQAERGDREGRARVDHRATGSGRRAGDGALEQFPTTGTIARRAIQGAMLLAEPAHDEQTVVDREPQSDGGHNVDHGRVDVGDEGEPEQHAESADDGDDRADERDSGGEEAAEHHEHDEQRDRQRDGLAASQVLLRGLDDRVHEQRGAAHLRGRAGELGTHVAGRPFEGGEQGIRGCRIGLRAAHPGDRRRNQEPVAALREQSGELGERIAVRLAGRGERIGQLHAVEVRDALGELGRDRDRRGIPRVDADDDERERRARRAAPGEHLVGIAALAVDGRRRAVEPIEERLTGHPADGGRDADGDDGEPGADRGHRMAGGEPARPREHSAGFIAHDHVIRPRARRRRSRGRS